MMEVNQPDLDAAVAHTIRIELMNDRTLAYWVSPESKRALYKFLARDAISDNSDPGFIWFYIPLDRLVLVNKNDIVRITFCFDPGIDPRPKYRDNFNLSDTAGDPTGVEDPEDENDRKADETCIPQLIVMHHRQLEDEEFVKGVTMKSEGYFGNISSYSSLEQGDVEGFDFDYHDGEEQWVLMTWKYLQFADDDGEENFMPLHNLTVIEIERPLLMSDATLDRYLERKTKK
jgi:hypothetical protein